MILKWIWKKIIRTGKQMSKTTNNNKEKERRKKGGRWDKAQGFKSYINLQ